jgi:hypothetical protein
MIDSVAGVIQTCRLRHTAEAEAWAFLERSLPAALAFVVLWPWALRTIGLLDDLFHTVPRRRPRGPVGRRQQRPPMPPPQ